jgi:undecaprenyl-diphosphatase
MEAMETPWLVELSRIFDRSGSVPLVLVVILVGFLVLARWGRLRTGLIWLAMVVVTIGLSESVEKLVARPRPTSSLIIKSSFSYPSGHTMVSGIAIGVGFALFASILWPHRHRAFLAIGMVYAVAVSVSRIYLRAHWLTDVAGGLIMAAPVLALAIAYWRRSLAVPGDTERE